LRTGFPLFQYFGSNISSYCRTQKLMGQDRSRPVFQRLCTIWSSHSISSTIAEDPGPTSGEIQHVICESNYKHRKSRI